MKLSNKTVRDHLGDGQGHRQRMKTLSLLLLGASLIGCSRELPPYAKAQAAFNTSVTNSPGWRRTIETSVNVYDDDWKKWQGRAEIEYVNAAGGLDRTNLPFRFTVTQSEGKTNVGCYLDVEQIIAVRRVLDEFIPGETPQQFNERLQRARTGAK